MLTLLATPAFDVQVFPLSTLDCFYEDELETLLCGSGEAWTVQSLADSIKFDHGYTGSSPVVKCFLEVLSELDAADRRKFLRFVTGGWFGGCCVGLELDGW